MLSFEKVIKEYNVGDVVREFINKDKSCKKTEIKRGTLC